MRGQVVSALSKPCERLEDADVDPNEPASKSYAVRLDKGSWQEGVWSGIGVFSDAVSGSLRACNSREGLHYTVWKGKPLRSALLWHAYEMLGYEAEPGGPTGCKDQDYAE